MEYNAFCEEFKKGILENQEWNIGPDNYFFYPNGYTVSKEDKSAMEFIYNTNIRYHRVESDKLIGDFVVLYVEEAGTIKMNCRFSMEYLYEEFSHGGWERVWLIVKENIDFTLEINESDIINRMKEYEAVKERLILRPINYADNRYSLKNMVYRQYGDIALVLYAVIYNNKERGLGTVKIPKDTFECWGQDIDIVWNAAMMNTYTEAMPRMYLTPEECMDPPFERGAFMALNSEIDSLTKRQIPTITTTKQVNGAIAMFYPGVQQRIAQLFNGSYYVAFTSIHDARVHHKDSISPRMVLNSLKSVNQAFPKEELLSRKIFFYDYDKNTFEQLEL